MDHLRGLAVLLLAPCLTLAVIGVMWNWTLARLVLFGFNPDPRWGRWGVRVFLTGLAGSLLCAYGLNFLAG
jgi:hypothetical protein